MAKSMEEDLGQFEERMKKKKEKEKGEQPVGEDELDQELESAETEAESLDSPDAGAKVVELREHQSGEDAELDAEHDEEVDGEREEFGKRVEMTDIQAVADEFSAENDEKLVDLPPEKIVDTLKMHHKELAQEARKLRENPEASEKEKASLGKRMMGKMFEAMINMPGVGAGIEAMGKMGLMPGVSKERAAEAGINNKEQMKFALKILGLFDKRAKLIKGVADPLLDHQIRVDQKIAAGEEIDYLAETKEGLRIMTPEDDSKDEAFLQKAGDWLLKTAMSTEDENIKRLLEVGGENLKAHSKEVSKGYRKWLEKGKGKPGSGQGLEQEETVTAEGEKDEDDMSYAA